MNFKLSKGFTLAEVLIVLGIIGVVAAITIPNLITNYKVKVTRNRLIDTQAILSQALRMAVYENGSPEGWDIGNRDTKDGAKKLYDIMFLNTIKSQDCNKKACFATSYKALDGKTKFRVSGQLGAHFAFYSGQLINGVSFLTWSTGSGCKSSAVKNQCGAILVDINGPSKPNRAGFDLFEFLITKDNIIPSGGRTYKNSESWSRCGYSGNDNGTTCTAWLIEKGNMDYLKKEITWD